MTIVPESPLHAPGFIDAYAVTSADLLRAIAGALDVRSLLPHLSQIVGQLLPHDAMAVGSIDGTGALVFAAATADLRELHPHPLESHPPGDIVIGDLSASPRPEVYSDAAARLSSRGYRSLLTTATQAGDLKLGLQFWSRRLHAYEAWHLPLARRHRRSHRRGRVARTARRGAA